MSNCILINGVQIPAPDRGFEIVESQTVDAGRNAKNEVIGQLIGRKLWKINGLQWTGLSVEEWKHIKTLLKPFFVLVTFTADDNVQRTIYMYPSDTTGKPLRYIEGMGYSQFSTCKFNLIDCGWD